MNKFFYCRVWSETHATNKFKQQADVDVDHQDKLVHNVNMKSDQGIAFGLCILALCWLVGLVGNLLIAIWF